MSDLESPLSDQIETSSNNNWPCCFCDNLEKYFHYSCNRALFVYHDNCVYRLFFVSRYYAEDGVKQLWAV